MTHPWNEEPFSSAAGMSTLINCVAATVCLPRSDVKRKPRPDRKGGAGSSRQRTRAAIVISGARFLPIGTGAGMVDFTVELVLWAALTIEITRGTCHRRIRCDI
jgi:hypothetical protein